MAHSASLPSTTTRPQLSKVFSSHHLDDQSIYYARDSVSESREDHCTADEESDLSESTAQEEDKEARGLPLEDTAASHHGSANPYNLEAPLEKKQSSKSVKDPNLVSGSSQI